MHCEYCKGNLIFINKEIISDIEVRYCFECSHCPRTFYMHRRIPRGVNYIESWIEEVRT